MSKKTYEPIRDVSYYDRQMELLRANPTARDIMRTVNTHCRCVCRELPEGEMGCNCYNPKCHFGVLKTHFKYYENKYKQNREARKRKFQEYGIVYGKDEPRHDIGDKNRSVLDRIKEIIHKSTR